MTGEAAREGACLSPRMYPASYSGTCVHPSTPWRVAPHLVLAALVVALVRHLLGGARLRHLGLRELPFAKRARGRLVVTNLSRVGRCMGIERPPVETWLLSPRPGERRHSRASEPSQPWLRAQPRVPSGVPHLPRCMRGDALAAEGVGAAELDRATLGAADVHAHGAVLLAATDGARAPRALLHLGLLPETVRRACAEKQRCSGFGQLALRRLLSAPGRASGASQPRPVSRLEPRWPAVQALFFT